MMLFTVRHAAREGLIMDLCLVLNWPKPYLSLLDRDSGTNPSQLCLNASSCVFVVNGSICRHGNYNVDPGLCCRLAANQSRADHPQGNQYWLFAFLPLIPIFTLFGNILVVLSVIKNRNLHNITNIFIVSLAIADISLAVLVMPLAIWVQVSNGHWHFSDSFCDVYVMFDVMLCTASILNLVAISVDRFVAVVWPLKYSKSTGVQRGYITVGVVWVVSFGIAVPLVAGMNNTSMRAEGACAFFNSDFLIYSSLGSFYIPCAIMVLLYYRIFSRLKERALMKKELSGKKEYQPHHHHHHHHQPHQRMYQNSAALTSEKPNGRHPNDIAMTSFNDSEACTTMVVFSESAGPRTAMLSVEADFRTSNTTSTSEETTYIGSNPAALASCRDASQTCATHSTVFANGGCVGICLDDFGLEETPVDEAFESWEEFRAYLRRRVKVAKRGGNAQELFEAYAKSRRAARQKKRKHKKLKKALHTHCLTVKDRLQSIRVKRKKREKSAARREKKATMTLAIVLAVFLFCWTPFFTINILDALCLKFRSWQKTAICNYPPFLYSICVWLGYINSFLNPIIYTIFNADFRNAFKRLLHIK